MRLNKLTLQDELRRFDMETPCGKLLLIASAKGLRAVLWELDQEELAVRPNEVPICTPVDGSQWLVLNKTVEQLTAYFNGALQLFDIPLDMVGTPFQMESWRALQTIPYGQTMSYGAQAELVGGRNKARAVGNANRTNPISIIVPCHRVIGKSGDLTGFAGGLATKSLLLDLEHSTMQSIK